MKPGVLVISHGSRVSDWVSHVDRAAEAVRECLNMAADSGLVPIEAAFLELVGGRLIQDGIDRLEAAGVTDMLAIPLFVSSGSKHVDEIGWALGAYDKIAVETNLERFRMRAALTYGKPVDVDPEIVEVLLDRLRELSVVPGSESLLLIGHGSEHAGLYEAWRRGLRELAAEVRTRGGYADAEIAMLRPDSAADAVGRLRARRPGCEVLAVPVFLGEGYFTTEVVPKRLANLGCRYRGRTLMPHPLIAEWIARQAEDWLLRFSGFRKSCSFIE